MHANLLNQLASQRADELRHQPGHTRPHVSRPGPRNSVRYRAGRTLVEIGLRLAGSSRDG
jgi:hypothetical protein